VHIRAKAERDGFKLSVQDAGPGFPPEERENVFDKFYRLKNQAPGGTGLGLSIAKGLVNAHGGTIQLENATGGGALFIIHIPSPKLYLTKTADHEPS
jgi:two-component system sensor histidine kinase KdpD